ncbi:MAG TPA: 16S rRNA (cytosine(1402)-N(4))-methyltransferase RsmH [Chthonomonadaceae bacterium]|nr:16S rRNA (cytosine(1402)-N(4))-methyltransferase RsmH [Chthonomonadaceae bacterium]
MQPTADAYHEPVLLAETLRLLAPKPGETMLDSTLGGGGHSAALAQALSPGGTLIGLDRDPEALQAARIRLEPFRSSLTIILIYTEFSKLEVALEQTEGAQGLQLDGVLFDLGVSSHQLDTARGFSFRRDEPLDMRMDAASGAPTAADLLATASEPELARILLEYGEERFARRIVRALIERRRSRDPVRTTGQLVEVVARAVPRAAWPRDLHVATRTFQALRIAVNDELGQLQEGLAAAVERLNPGGRIAVISYHSLEDRIVKQAFARWAGRAPSVPGSSPAAFLPPPEDAEPTLTLLTRKPIVPTAEEIARNPRARSARLRAARRRAGK